MEILKEKDKTDEELIRAKFRTSFFNKCSHKKLDSMKGNKYEMNLFIKKDAKPHTAKGLRYVPKNMEEKVKEQLEKDVRMGVI